MSLSDLFSLRLTCQTLNALVCTILFRDLIVDADFLTKQRCGAISGTGNLESVMAACIRYMGFDSPDIWSEPDAEGIVSFLPLVAKFVHMQSVE